MNKNKKNQDLFLEIDILSKLTSLFNLKKTELRIYNLLRSNKKPMLVTEICKSLNTSRRLVQDYLKGLTEKGFLKREIVHKKRLSYVYIAQPPLVICRKIKNNINIIIKQGNKLFRTSSVK